MNIILRYIDLNALYLILGSCFDTDLIRGECNLPAPGPDYAVSAVSDMNFGRASSIYGGSNEIQRNVIAKAVLGL